MILIWQSTNFCMLGISWYMPSYRKEQIALPKKFNSYQALVRQLAKNHQCSLEDLTIAAVNDGNYELLDLLEKSGAEPCQYFDNKIYESLIKKCELKTIMWFDKKMNLNLRTDNIIYRIICAACGNKIYLQAILDNQQFIAENPDTIDTFINITFTTGNIDALDWFFEKYPDQTDKYLVNIIDDVRKGKIITWYYLSTLRWLIEHEYLDLSLDKTSLFKKIIVIEKFIKNGTNGSILLDMLDSNTDVTINFVRVSSFVREHETDLSQFRAKIIAHMHVVIHTIIGKNDMDTFRWIITNMAKDIIVNHANIILAFECANVEIIQYLIDHKYQLNSLCRYLEVIAGLSVSKMFPMLELFEKIARSNTEIKRKKIPKLIQKAICVNNSKFLSWLTKYFGLSPTYFTTNQLNKIFRYLATYKQTEVTQFFVDNGYEIRLECCLTTITNANCHFIKYILGNSAIKKEFGDESTFKSIYKMISTHDTELLQWYIKTYVNGTITEDVIIAILAHVLNYGTDKQALWFLDYVWQLSSGPMIVHETTMYKYSALIHGSTKILDWLRSKEIEIKHPRDVIGLVIERRKFNAIYYMRKYLGMKIQIENYLKFRMKPTRPIYLDSLKYEPNCFDYRADLVE